MVFYSSLGNETKKTGPGLQSGNGWTPHDVYVEKIMWEYINTKDFFSCVQVLA